LPHRLSGFERELCPINCIPRPNKTMKTHIFCFSSTGNGLAISRSLAAKLGETKIFSIPRIISAEPDLSAGRIGIVFPMYYGGIPGIVQRFIEKLSPVRGKYVFAITSGKDENSPLGVMIRTKKLLREQGLELSGGFYVRMVSNFIPMFDALPHDEQKRRFAEAEVTIARISKAIADGKKRIEKNSFLKNWLMTTIIHPLLAAGIPKADRNFWVDEKCNGCGTCRKVCPVGNIELANGKPVWQHHCELCLGCLQWCPQEAIQYRKKTLHRNRYRNPDVTLKDFLYR